MNDHADPYQITSQLGMTAVFQTLKSQKSLVHMSIERNGLTAITTVLDTAPQHGQIIVDAATDEPFNQHLIAADIIHFEGLADKIRVQFSTGPAQPCTVQNRDALLLPYPAMLRRLQRRDHFRITIPVTMSLSCLVPADNGTALTLQVKDISAGGVALLDPDHIITGGPGTLLKQCIFELDDIGTVVTTIEVRRINPQHTTDTTPARLVACEFVHPDPKDKIMLLNYIGRLDRLLNARRRDYD